MSCNNSIKSGNIYIISGQWKGRKLPVPNNANVRPTANRVRETLFNWLAPYIQQSRCLDCFAGSGALGLEALSRYADLVTFLELKRSIAHLLMQNLKKLCALQAKVIETNTLQFLSQTKQVSQYDIVFIDPPFRKGLTEKTIRLLEETGWLANNAWIYVESEVENSQLHTPNNWHQHRKKIAGQVVYYLYKRYQKI
ncbi:16S rRNA (guanine(966)-N(2))-methyltransferase RsmD [Candidatus Pantoea carbekii]